MNQFTEVYYATSMKELTFLSMKHHTFKARVTFDVINRMIALKEYNFRVVGVVGTTMCVIEVFGDE